MKPDFIEEITKEKFIGSLVSDIETTLGRISEEARLITKDHTHNLAVARIMMQLWHEYASMVGHLAGARSLAEPHYVFYHDKRNGRYDFKHSRMPWEAVVGQPAGPGLPSPSALGGPTLGPSGTERQYL